MKVKYRGVIYFLFLLLVGYMSQVNVEVIIVLFVGQENVNDFFVVNNVMVGKLFDVVVEWLEKLIIFSKLVV